MLEELEKKIRSAKQLTTDERFELIDAAGAVQDKLSDLIVLIGEIPEAEPEEGVQDPRDAFVDELMAGEREIKVT